MLATGELAAARLLAAHAESFGGARNRGERIREHLAAVVDAGERKTGREKAVREDTKQKAARGSPAELAAARCGLGALTGRPRLAASGVHAVPWRPELWSDLAAASA